jgi:hypothetical protein
MFGLPRTVTLVLLAALIGMAGLASRNGWLGLLGNIVFYYAHKDLGALETLMRAGDGGALNQAQQGMQYFGWALMLGWVLLVGATLFVAKHNADQRQIAKRAALAAGEDPPMGPLDNLVALTGKKIGIAVEAAQAERQRARAGAGD